VLPNSWKNRKQGTSKLRIKEMGSRYLFIILYCWLERVLSRGDYSGQTRKHQLQVWPRRVWRYFVRFVPTISTVCDSNVRAIAECPRTAQLIRELLGSPSKWRWIAISEENQKPSNAEACPEKKSSKVGSKTLLR
jgi:hypothetical protein